jgi:hypothetical protein
VHEQHVEVAVGRELAAPEPSDRDERDARAWCLLVRHLEQLAQPDVGGLGERAARSPAGH